MVSVDIAEKRKREVLMRPGVWAVLFKTFVPSLLDWLTFKMFLEPVIRRAKDGKVDVNS